jgi:hypothetical protein
MLKSLSVIALLIGIGTIAVARPVCAVRQPVTFVLTADSVDVNQYVGKYNLGNNGVIPSYTITVKDGQLYGEAEGYGAFKLVKQKDADTWQSTSSYGSMILFTRDAKTNAVTGLKLTIQGNELIGTREK